MSSAYDTICAAIKTALDAVYAAKNHTHTGYASSGHDHASIQGGTSGLTLVGDYDTYLSVFNDSLIYNVNDDATYYKDDNDPDCELATKGDIDDAIGDAITVINGSGSS